MSLLSAEATGDSPNIASSLAYAEVQGRLSNSRIVACPEVKVTTEAPAREESPGVTEVTNSGKILL